MIRNLVVLLTLAAAVPAGAQSPYSGLTERPTKALSPQQLDDLRQGRGMGLSLPAELNHHPGPAHVLEHAEALRLTPAQKDGVEAVMERMTERARRLGEEIIGAEAALEAQFAADADAAQVAAAAEALGALWGRLRGVHLVAHIEARKLLSSAQIEAYDQLRGYGSEAGGHQHHGHDRHG